MLNLIKLENFRSHKKYEIKLEPITVIIGQNGVGKSNILEAISLLSFCRSFREEDKKNLINFDANYARVVGDDLEVFIQRSPYIFKSKAKGVPQKQTDFIGKLRSVVFSPESLLLLSDGPKSRRRFMDIMIAQRDHEYLRCLVNYEKVKTERNALLSAIYEGRAKAGELSFWDDQLVAEGQVIINRRRETLASIGKKLSFLYQSISDTEETLEISYLTNVTTFQDDLDRNRRREIAIGRTIIGPHKDDFVINLNSLNVQNFASRGEARSAILSLKMAEVEFLSEKEHERPVLLLDDIFSEFDDIRRGRLYELIKEYQTVITTTDKEYLSEDLLSNAKIIDLKL